MGYGHYSQAAHTALLATRSSKSIEEVFAQSACHAMMNPHGLKMRESRDSVDHPNSLAIVFALDVTGSMGDIPRQLATKELPTFMKLISGCGIPDPQLMFMAIGDAMCDQAPLQVGQFESTAELMDQWLTWSYLEGGGGGNGGESYELAFYTLAQHTDIDCWTKRQKRGYLFMTGDDLPFPAVSRHQIEAYIGEKLDDDIPIEEAIAAAAEMYHLFFLIPDPGRRAWCESRWRDLLGNNVICMESSSDACAVAAAIIALTEKAVPNLKTLHETLQSNQISAQQASAVIRAIQPYAAQLDASLMDHMTDAATTPNANDQSWWKKIFG